MNKSEAIRERIDILKSLSENITRKDIDMFRAGYIPISWSLINISYVEATNIVLLKKAWRDAEERYMVR